MKNIQKEYEKLRAKLPPIGYVLQGTILERYVEKRSGTTGQKNTTGPYYQWTRKIRGKSTTVNLSKSQYEVYSAAIEENRKLEETLLRMRELSEEILDQTTEGVIKRKRRVK